MMEIPWYTNQPTSRDRKNSYMTIRLTASGKRGDDSGDNVAQLGSTTQRPQDGVWNATDAELARRQAAAAEALTSQQMQSHRSKGSSRDTRNGCSNDTSSIRITGSGGRSSWDFSAGEKEPIPHVLSLRSTGVNKQDQFLMMIVHLAPSRGTILIVQLGTVKCC